MSTTAGSSRGRVPGSCRTPLRHDGVRRHDYRMVPEEFIDAGGDQVLVFSREGGRGKGNGAEVQTNPTARLWTLRDGKAIRMESYWDRAEALEAAGLSE
jgi:ketosteroid isomerase-like protein